MADDSWDVDINMNFHSCNKPHGMKDYVLKDLTPEQQNKLNELKRKQIRDDQKYLAAHPEIRGIINMILRLLLKLRPKTNIQEFIGMYFTKSCIDIQEDVINYLKERENVLAENSFMLLTQQEEEKELEEEKDLEEEQEEEALEEQEEEEKEVEDEETTERVVNLHELELSEKDMVFAEIELMERRKYSSTEIVCKEILNEILDTVFEDIDLPSLTSITSEKVLNYEDHAIGSLQSLSVDHEDDE